MFPSVKDWKMEILSFSQILKINTRKVTSFTHYTLNLGLDNVGSIKRDKKDKS